MTTTHRVVLVTGASGGIGEAIVERLASDGFGVAIHAHSRDDRAAALCDRVRSGGGEAGWYAADLAGEEAVGEMFSAIDRDFGRLDGLVSNAGVFPRSTVVSMSVAEWDHVLAVNLRSTFLVCRAAVRHFLERQIAGRIVTIASGAAARGMARGAHYAASKAGIVAFTKSLALEVAPDHVLVNCVAPSTIDTPMPRGGATEAELRERSRTLVPLGRMGVPADVAEVASFLLNERLTWLTGQTIWINGGELML